MDVSPLQAKFGNLERPLESLAGRLVIIQDCFGGYDHVYVGKKDGNRVDERDSTGKEKGEEVEVPFIRISHILLPKSWSRRGRPNAGRKLGGESARKARSVRLTPFWK